MPSNAQELEHARLAVERFVERFDESYRLLAFHAALPLVLTPELLSYLRSQFLRGQVPWVAEADLLLSTDLCRQVGYEQYALEPPVRAYLIGEMRQHPELGVGRMQAVARRLIDYVRHQALANPTLGEANVRAQEWSAMVFLDDERRRASQAIAEAFREAAPAAPGVTSRSDRAELARLVKITQALAPELGDYPELIEFAEGLGRMLADPRGVEFGPTAPAAGPVRAPKDAGGEGIALPTIRTPVSPTPPTADVRSATRVYVSSTYSDLREYRQRVVEVLKQAGIDPIEVEGDADTDERPLARGLAAVAACDVYLGLIAWRYGAIPPQDNPDDLSITELEYRHAVRLGKPRLIFLMEEDAAGSSEYLYQGDAGRRINRLRTELKKRETVQFFRDPDQLAALVVTSIRHYSSMDPTPEAIDAIATEQALGEARPERGAIEIYVSFARIDDEPDSAFPDRPGWVTTLVRGVQRGLAQKLGRTDFVLWHDAGLAGVTGVSSEILGRIRDAAALLVVLSPAYLASEWCRRELAVFDEEGPKRNAPGDRIFVVELDRVDPSHRPAELVGLRGYPFWFQDPSTLTIRILGYPIVREKDEEYFKRLNDLCIDLAQDLRASRLVGQAGTSPATAPRPDPRPVVYLSEVTDDVDFLRDDVRRYLEQAGLRVLPTKRYSRDIEEYRKAAEADMRQALLFVQLLSESPGRRFSRSEWTFVTLQYELARMLELPVLQWRSRDLNTTHVADNQHRGLLESPTVIACDLTEFEATVMRRVRELGQPPRPRVSTPRTEVNPFIFVNSARVDIDLAREVGEAVSALGALVVLPLLDGDASKIRTYQDEQLRDCDALLLIHGQVNVAWVREQLLRARRANATRQAPLERIGIYQASPVELGLISPNVWIIEGRFGVAKALLGNFLQIQ
jgi:hypothetical protein